MSHTQLPISEGGEVKGSPWVEFGPSSTTPPLANPLPPSSITSQRSNKITKQKATNLPSQSHKPADAHIAKFHSFCVEKWYENTRRAIFGTLLSDMSAPISIN